MEEKKISIPLVIGGFVLVIIIGAGGVVLLLRHSDSENSTNTFSNNTIINPQPISNNSLANNMESPLPATSTTKKYKDGTYTATGNYVSPDGPETIDVSVTLANDNVSAVTVTPGAFGGDSRRYETQFSRGISSIVVGKPLDQAYVHGNVNGSSLTGDGFDDALDQIKTQAQV